MNMVLSGMRTIPIRGTLLNMILVGIILTFMFSLVLCDLIRVKESEADICDLPGPMEMISSTAEHSLPVLKGIQLDVDNPLHISFILDPGHEKEVSSQDIEVLVRYFLGALTIPQKSLWVNLSPYEHDRIIDHNLGVTDMGREMLAQDYILKQLAASLTHPDTPTGEIYWRNRNERNDDLNKVWITPDEIEVLEHKNSALIRTAKLKVLSESDYLAYRQSGWTMAKSADTSEKASAMDAILPAIEREVNEGKNFAPLRQVYHSVILGLWFKQKFRESFYRYYIDNKKIDGIDLVDEAVKEKIYALYVRSFEKGLYDYIKKEFDSGSRKAIHRRYFSGGVVFGDTDIGNKTQPVSGNDYQRYVTSPDTYTAGSAVKLVDIDIAGKFLNFAGNSARRIILPVTVMIAATMPFLGKTGGDAYGQIVVTQGNVAEYAVKPFPLPNVEDLINVNVLQNQPAKNTYNSILNKFNSTYGGEVAFSIKQAMAYAVTKSGISSDAPVIDGIYVQADKHGVHHLQMLLSDRPDGPPRRISVSITEVNAYKSAVSQRQRDSLMAANASVLAKVDSIYQRMNDHKTIDKIDSARIEGISENVLVLEETFQFYFDDLLWNYRGMIYLKKGLNLEDYDYAGGGSDLPAGEAAIARKLQWLITQVHEKTRTADMFNDAIVDFSKKLENVLDTIEQPDFHENGRRDVNVRYKLANHLLQNNPDVKKAFNDVYRTITDGLIRDLPENLRKSPQVEQMKMNLFEKLGVPAEGSAGSSLHGGVDLENTDISIIGDGTSSAVIKMPAWDFNRLSGLSFSLRRVRDVSDFDDLKSFGIH
jgi:hypothetical protein